MSFLDNDINETALRQLYRFPKLTVKRILIPHFLGLSIPAMILAFFFIQVKVLSLPTIYILYALVASFLVASMHALIEFYLTSKAIQPIATFLKDKLHEEGYATLIDDENRISIKSKLRATILLIGIFPIILFILAGQVKLQELTGSEMGQYWKWAGVILFVTVNYAFLTSKFLASELQKPINQLQKMMSDVEKQKYEFLKTNVYTDEFSHLFSGFNKMILEIQQREKENRQLLESYLTVLSATLDARDPYTAGHSQRVASYSNEIGRALKLTDSESDLLNRTALLHDIGKIGVPDRVLLKEGKLSVEEFELIKAHPVIGERILREVEPVDHMIGLLPGVRSHHERIDGNGYPDRLSGTDIPIFGRIIAVADAFDAMTSDRPYRKGMSKDLALTILINGKDLSGTKRLWIYFLICTK
jgi:hypothetical protein